MLLKAPALVALGEEAAPGDLPWGNVQALLRRGWKTQAPPPPVQGQLGARVHGRGRRARASACRLGHTMAGPPLVRLI